MINSYLDSRANEGTWTGAEEGGHRRQMGFNRSDWQSNIIRRFQRQMVHDLLWLYTLSRLVRWNRHFALYRLTRTWLYLYVYMCVCVCFLFKSLDICPDEMEKMTNVVKGLGKLFVDNRTFCVLNRITTMSCKYSNTFVSPVHFREGKYRITADFHHNRSRSWYAGSCWQIC